MAAIAGGIGSLVLLYSVKYMAGQEGLTRYYALVLLFIGSMIGLVFVDNLLVLYFFWEAVGLCSYALIGFYTKDPKAAKAGIKALVTTRVGDIGFLIGIFVLASGAMTALGVDFWQALSIHSLIQNVSSIPMQTLSIAGFCFLLGAMGKSAQVPLHVWLPDAMEAPTTISALIHAATMVNAGVYLLARSLPLFSGVPYWMTALMVVGGITAFLAATMALVEHDLKRVLAYSTVSQLGYMIFGLGASFWVYRSNISSDEPCDLQSITLPWCWGCDPFGGNPKHVSDGWTEERNETDLHRDADWWFVSCGIDPSEWILEQGYDPGDRLGDTEITSRFCSWYSPRFLLLRIPSGC